MPFILTTRNRECDPSIYLSVEVLATTARENVASSGKHPVGANLHFFRALLLETETVTKIQHQKIQVFMSFYFNV